MGLNFITRFIFLLTLVEGAPLVIGKITKRAHALAGTVTALSESVLEITVCAVIYLYNLVDNDLSRTDDSVLHDLTGFYLRWDRSSSIFLDRYKSNT